MKRASGFSIVEVLIVVTVVILVGLIGYNLYSMQQSPNADVTEQQSAGDDTPAAPEINDTADLDKAAATLDQIDPDTNDRESAELDSSVAF